MFVKRLKKTDTYILICLATSILSSCARRRSFSAGSPFSYSMVESVF
ncbi:hypothetical protein AALP_AA2G159800 [Arabis alpina]|uniref:Lipoprotein n=1 Tax=Arabis alpina TaxID=50452 RepID=A0A087HHT4_ARAAL|nr:hypothetical protein AALP_AA2G159800 [Arabis alpina]